MESVYNILNHFIYKDSNTGIKQIIAKEMLNRLNEIPEIKLEELANICDVSRSSIIRFCQELGFDDFTHFRKSVKSNFICIDKTRENLLPEITNIENDEIDSNRLFTILNEIEGSIIDKVDHNQLKKIANDIYEFPYIYVYGDGFSNLIGEYLRLQLSYNNKFIQNRLNINQVENLPTQKNKTLGILISQHLRNFETSPRILNYLKENSDCVWLITHDENFIDNNIHILNAPSDTYANAEFHSMIFIVELISEYYKKLLKKKHRT